MNFAHKYIVLIFVYQNILAAVTEFAAMLDGSDQMAVLCILSHGVEGCVFGCDGKVVSQRSITSRLNNVNCSSMINKPKALIIQACQVGMY